MVKIDFYVIIGFYVYLKPIKFQLSFIFSLYDFYIKQIFYSKFTFVALYVIYNTFVVWLKHITFYVQHFFFTPDSNTFPV